MFTWRQTIGIKANQIKKNALCKHVNWKHLRRFLDTKWKYSILFDNYNNNNNNNLVLSSHKDKADSLISVSQASPQICDWSEVMWLESPIAAVHTLHHQSVQRGGFRWLQAVLGFVAVYVARHLHSGWRSSQPATGLKLNTLPSRSSDRQKLWQQQHRGLMRRVSHWAVDLLWHRRPGGVHVPENICISAFFPFNLCV